jgi:tetratricopeptide (TPR) repeat protein
MVSDATPLDKRIDLAQHYLKKFTAASSAYRRGHENTVYALTLFDQEWLQIKHWWQWVNLQGHSDGTVAQLGVGYGLQGEELLNLRQTPQERLEWLEAGLVSTRKARNQEAELIFLFRMAWAIHKQAQLDDAETTAYKALAIAESSGDLLYLGRILNLLGEISMRRGNYREAHWHCSRSLEFLLALQAETYLLDTYFALSEIAYLQGELTNAYDYAQQGVTIVETRGVEGSSGSILNWIGVLSLETGDYESAAYYISQSIESNRAKNNQPALAQGLCILGYMEYVRGNYVEAERHFSESLEIAQATGEAWLIQYIELEQAYLFHLRGNWQAAEQSLYRAVDYGRASGYRGHLAQALNFLAEVQIERNDLALARVTLAEGLQIACEDGNKLETTRSLWVAAKFALKSGKTEQAAEWLGALLNQPNVIAPIMNMGKHLYPKIRQELNNDLFEAAFERGKNLSLDGAITNLAKELNAWEN